MFIRLYKKLVVIDLSRQKELDPKAIKQIELVGQVKNDYGINADRAKSYVCFSNFIKSPGSKIKIFWRKCNSIIKDSKLSRSESYANQYVIKQSKICSKNKTGAILRMNTKNFV